MITPSFSLTATERIIDAEVQAFSKQ